MKEHLLLLLFSLSATLLFSQAKKNIGGVDLYQKGSCERVSAKFVSCTYCTDKELKNCKEYWCTDDGTCTEAPSRKNNQLSSKDSSPFRKVFLDKKDTTSTLPKGLKFEKNNIVLEKGCKGVISADKTIVFILSNNGLGIMGGFSCYCNKEAGDCRVNIVGNKVICGGADCCEIVVTINSEVQQSLTIKEAEQAPEKLTWKKLILPTKAN